MRHIAVRAYGEPPCHGDISEVPRPPDAAPDSLTPPAATPATPPGAPSDAPRPTRLPSLPILGKPAAATPATIWRCGRCGTTWQHEPLPDEAL